MLPPSSTSRWVPASSASREPFIRLFESLFNQHQGEDIATRPWTPPVNVHETGEAYVVIAELPGMSREDIDIRLENNILRLAGERKFERDEKTESYHRIEFAYGSFSRSFSLPGQVDAQRVQASLKDGVLTVILPKSTDALAEDSSQTASYASSLAGGHAGGESMDSELTELLLGAERLHRERVEGLIQSLLPPATIPSAVAILQARRNAEAREALFQEFGALTSSEVAELAGSEAKNRAALANRWKQEERIFSVTRHGLTLFPGFQFDEQGRPKPVIAEVIRALGDEGSQWELALWFTKASGWLGGRRPVDLLDDEPQVVIEAANHEAAGIVF
jgi:HSP20 family molecular chaperone IbpA